MKKLYFLFFALLTVSLCFSQGTETFDTFSETGSSYADGTFTGQDGSTWTYVQSRGDQSITGKSLMLGRNRTPQAEVYSGTISGGVGTISFNYEQTFSTNVSLDVLINDVVYGTVTSSNESGVTKASGSITVNQPGNVVIKFKSTNNGDGQVTIDDITWTGYAGAPTPTISVSSASGSMFYWETMGPSDEETFTVSGINLTADIVVSAPTNYEISTTSGSGFGASINLSPSSGTVNSTTIYVRLKSGLIEGSYNEDATCSSTGATNGIVSLTGTVGADDPNIFVSNFPGDLEYLEGSGPSPEDDFTVSGLFLTENILVTAPANFEVSLTSGSGFGNSVSVSQTGGTAAETTVYVRLAGGLTAAGSPYSGDVTCSSAGATNETVSLDGAVNPVATCSGVGDVIFTEIMQNPSGVSDGNGEYFELYNTTGSPIVLDGWVIKDDATASESHTITSLTIPANDYVVLGVNADSGTNGGVTVDYEYSGVFLGNGDDGIILECSSTTIDSVIWDDGDTFPDPNGASMELSTTAMNATDNDNGANWGESTGGPLGSGDNGTPGSANSFTLSSDDFEIESFKMYPNPTSLGYINISSKRSSKMEVSVFDLLGKQVINDKVSNGQLDVSRLNSGVYIMKVEQDEASVTKKLVIQ